VCVKSGVRSNVLDGPIPVACDALFPLDREWSRSCDRLARRRNLHRNGKFSRIYAQARECPSWPQHPGHFQGCLSAKGLNGDIHTRPPVMCLISSTTSCWLKSTPRQHPSARHHYADGSDSTAMIRLAPLSFARRWHTDHRPCAKTATVSPICKSALSAADTSGSDIREQHHLFIGQFVWNLGQVGLCVRN
jgi:hypothetical protein